MSCSKGDLSVSISLKVKLNNSNFMGFSSTYSFYLPSSVDKVSCSSKMGNITLYGSNINPFGLKKIPYEPSSGKEKREIIKGIRRDYLSHTFAFYWN